MVDAALLELEGVVFDTRDLRRVSLQDALMDHGLASTFDDERLDGYPPHAAVAAALAHQGVPHDDILIDLITMAAERAFATRLALAGAALRDGALDFVRESSATTRLVAVTRARRSDAETMLRLASIAEFFSIVISADDVIDAKPSVEGHRLAIERLRRQRPVAISTIMSIEDGAPGIRAAHDARVRCVAVGPMPAHVMMGADAYVPSLVGQTVRSLDQLLRSGQESVQ